MIPHFAKSQGHNLLIRISQTAGIPDLTFNPLVMVMATLEEDIIVEDALDIKGLDHMQN